MMKLNKLIFSTLIIFLSINFINSLELVNLTTVKNRVKKYYDSGQYQKELKKITTRAFNYFKKIKPKSNSVIIFDVDDTVISTYEYQKTHDFGFIKKLFDNWFMNHNMPAISETLELYNKLQKLGFKTIFITNKEETFRQRLLDVLENNGFEDFEQLIMKPLDKLHWPIAKYKTEARENLVKQNYEIVGNIGDQFADLEGSHTGYNVKLPNYMYTLSYESYESLL